MQHTAFLEAGLTVSKAITVGGDTQRVAVVVRDAASGAVGSVVIPASRLRGPR
jgi:NADPH-dependent curcumin reductase CurA